MTLLCNWGSLSKKIIIISKILLIALRLIRQIICSWYLCTKLCHTDSEIGFVALSAFVRLHGNFFVAIFNSRFLFLLGDGSRKQNWTRITMMRVVKVEFWKNKAESCNRNEIICSHLCQNRLTNCRYFKFIFILYLICVCIRFGAFMDLISSPMELFLWRWNKSWEFIEFFVTYVWWGKIEKILFWKFEVQVQGLETKILIFISFVKF
jgi:hypothetical protein